MKCETNTEVIVSWILGAQQISYLVHLLAWKDKNETKWSLLDT